MNDCSVRVVSLSLVSAGVYCRRVRVKIVINSVARMRGSFFLAEFFIFMSIAVDRSIIERRIEVLLRVRRRAIWPNSRASVFMIFFMLVELAGSENIIISIQSR